MMKSHLSQSLSPLGPLGSSWPLGQCEANIFILDLGHTWLKMSWGGKSGQAKGADFYVGEHVLLNGTGSRWGGGCFRAVVHEIRPEDNTVKVSMRPDTDTGTRRVTPLSAPRRR